MHSLIHTQTHNDVGRATAKFTFHQYFSTLSLGPYHQHHQYFWLYGTCMEFNVRLSTGKGVGPRICFVNMASLS